VIIFRSIKEVLGSFNMRSIRYMVGGDPHNMDDCVDYAQEKEKPTGIELKLVIGQRLVGMEGEWVLDEFFGRYTWTFPSFTVEYDEQYGGCYDHEPEKRRIKSAVNANRRLAGILGQFRELGFEVSGAEKRFNHVPPDYGTKDKGAAQQEAAK
jgi:hypothetical protein